MAKEEEKEKEEKEEKEEEEREGIFAQMGILVEKIGANIGANHGMELASAAEATPSADGDDAINVKLNKDQLRFLERYLARHPSPFAAQIMKRLPRARS